MVAVDCLHYARPWPTKDLQIPRVTSSRLPTSLSQGEQINIAGSHI